MKHLSLGIAILAVSAAALTRATAAVAITNGQPDGANHPYVGLMVAQDATGNPLWQCSGSLLSSTKFLMAAHCTAAPAAHVEIWFDPGHPTPIPLAAGYPAAGPNPCAGITGYPCTGDAGGTPGTNPLYVGGDGLHHDVGVVVLTSPFPMAQYAELPTAGQVDTRKNKTGIDLVGYGVEYQAKIPGNALHTKSTTGLEEGAFDTAKTHRLSTYELIGCVSSREKSMNFWQLSTMRC